MSASLISAALASSRMALRPSMMVLIPDKAAMPSAIPVMSVLLGEVGCVGASIVSKPRAGAFCVRTGGVHAVTRLRSSCRAATVCGAVLPVASMRSMQMPLQWCSFSAVKRGSHSSTKVICCNSSSMASSFALSASKLVGCDSLEV